MAGWLSIPSALAKDPSLIPCAPTSGGSQWPVTLLAPGDPMPLASSGACTDGHMPTLRHLK